MYRGAHTHTPSATRRDRPRLPRSTGAVLGLLLGILMGAAFSLAWMDAAGGAIVGLTLGMVRAAALHSPAAS